MKAIINRQHLLDALQVLRVVAKPSEFIPTSSGVLVERFGDRIRLTADNRETMCQLQIDAQLTGEGGVVMSADRLGRLLTYASDDNLHIAVKDGKSADLICGDTVARLPGSLATDFVHRGAFQGDSSFQVGLAEFKAVVSKVSPALMSGAGQTVKHGLHLLGDGRRLTIEACDGRALHMGFINASTEINAILPQNFIELIQALDGDNGCKFSYSENSSQLAVGETVIQTQFLEGIYPDTNQIIPAPSENFISLPKDDLIRAINVARVVMDNSGPGRLKITAKKEATTIAAHLCEAGDAQELVQSPNAYEIEFCIDALLLLTSIKQIQGKEVQIQCDDPLSAICMREGNFIAVIATMRPPPPIEQPIT